MERMYAQLTLSPDLISICLNVESIVLAKPGGGNSSSSFLFYHIKMKKITIQIKALAHTC